MMNKKSSNPASDTQYLDFFIRLGLSEEEAILYLTLTRKGILTALQLSRLTAINRTRVYRLLDRMKSIGLIEEVVDAHRTLTKAAGSDKLEQLLREQESKTQYLKKLFPEVIEIISGRETLVQPGTKVLFYRGKEGIRQQVWNTLRTKGKLLGYSYRPLIELIGDYYLKWYEEWLSRKLYMIDIYSDSYLKSKKPWHYDSSTRPTKYIHSRYIPSSILDINHQVDIYNDVVSYYNWFEGDVFGVEIYNEKIASMQRQFFQIVWKMTKPKPPTPKSS